MNAPAIDDSEEMEHNMVTMTESQVDALQRETGAIRYEQNMKYKYEPAQLAEVLGKLVFMRQEYMRYLKVCDEASDAQLRGYFFATYPSIAAFFGIDPPAPKYLTYVFNTTCRTCKTDQWKDMVMIIKKAMEHVFGSDEMHAAMLKHATESKFRTQHRSDMHYVDAEPVPVEPMPDVLKALLESRTDTDYESDAWKDMATATEIVLDPTTVSGKPGDRLKEAVQAATASVGGRRRHRRKR